MTASPPPSAFKEGVILFLKPWSTIDQSRLPFYDIQPQQLFHPVVIITETNANQDVVVCLVSSFERDSQRLKGSRRLIFSIHQLSSQELHSPFHHRNNFVIYPKRPPAPNLPQLRLVDDVRLRRQGYICARRSYLVHHTMLMLYDSTKAPDHYRLTPGSCAIVARHLGLPVLTVTQQRHLNMLAEMCRLKTEVERLRQVETEIAKLRQTEVAVTELRTRSQGFQKQNLTPKTSRVTVFRTVLSLAAVAFLAKALYHRQSVDSKTLDSYGELLFDTSGAFFEALKGGSKAIFNYCSGNMRAMLRP